MAVPHTGRPPAPSASADPLERPLAGQDPFFLEQTKKKGVKVRLRLRSVRAVRVEGLGSLSWGGPMGRGRDSESPQWRL